MTEPSREPAPWPHQPHPGQQPPGASWPYGPQPVHQQQRSAPTALAIASIVIAIVLTLVELATAVAAGPAASDFREAILGGQSSYDVLTWYDGHKFLLFPVAIAAYVVSCLWLQFARANALVISPHVHHQRSTVWAWLGWWVPIVSLWFPYQVVRDVQNGSSPTGRTVGLGLWWTTWLVFLFGTRASAKASTSSDPGLVDALTTFEWITAVAAVIACVQWCRIVLRTTANQREALAAPAPAR